MKIDYSFLINNIQNVYGWRTKRKIVVLESDDWGSIRMPSKKVFELLMKAGLRVDEDPYNKYDSFASEDDLTSLFEVLSSCKDKYGNPPVITANCIMANPDFDKIRASGFREYHYELFTETLKKYPKHSNSLKLWKEGISEKLICPQFHGREHLNVKRWMKALNGNSKDIRIAFDYGLFGILTGNDNKSGSHYMASFNFNDEKEKDYPELVVKEGLDLFEKVYGFRSLSFIAPCYTWSNWLEPFLYHNGIRYLKGNFIQAEPVNSSDKRKFIKRYHYNGQLNKHHLYYLLRNCFFEPSQKENFDWVSYCLRGIDNAFKWNKPASISMHRLNFIGFIDISNRNRNLPMLKTLLSEILKRWPDVEFMNSTRLGGLVNRQNLPV